MRMRITARNAHQNQCQTDTERRKSDTLGIRSGTTEPSCKDNGINSVPRRASAASGALLLLGVTVLSRQQATPVGVVGRHVQRARM